MSAIRLSAVLALLISVSPVTGQTPEHPLSSLRWQYRVIVFLDPPDVETAAEQFETWADALEERDIIWCIATSSHIMSNASDLASEATLSALRRQYGRGPTVVLVGKDGDLKQRASELDLGSLLALVDTMPMRRREMRDQP